MLWCILLLVSLAAATAQQQSQPAAAPASSSVYVGSAVCKTCHPDVWLSFYKNPHYKSIASGAEPAERTGCEGCHGPGKAHVAARGGKTTIPHAFSLMPPKQILDDCLSCHAKDFGKVNIRRSSHTMADVACTSCHSIHKSTAPIYLLARKQADLCYTCHLDVRSQFAMPFKHRVNEGVVQCSDCHNPHGTFAPTWRMADRPLMVQQAAGNETPCVKCHTDKRGPWVYEHAPLKVEGCEICHNPHGSMNAKLLRRPVVFTLCLECHNDSNPPDGGSGVRAQTATHNMLDPRYRQCTACHARIHGSNADPFFLR
jgi:DmsE family decaheme c-type cytochrome